MRLKLLKEQKKPTMNPPVKTERGFACFSEEFGEDCFGRDEAIVLLSKEQALELCKWLNSQLYGIAIERTDP